MRRVLPSLSMLLGTLALSALLVPLGLLGPLGGSAEAAPACTPPDAATAARQADAVFTGTVAAASQPDAAASPKRFTTPVTVQQSLKGSAGGQVSVITRGGHCEVGQLQQGATYLVFVKAHGQSWLAPGNLGTTATGLDTLVPQVQAALAPPKVTFGAPRSGTPMSFRRAAAPGVALVLVGLLGLLFVRRRRSA